MTPPNPKSWPGGRSFDGAPMTEIENGDSDWTRMLEVFPLNQAELERVLKIQGLLIQENCPLTAVLEEPGSSSASTFVESSVLPDLFLGTFFKKAISCAFVVGAPPDQQEKWTFLEAAVTCLGRRGPRSLHDLIFSYCVEIDGSNTVQTKNLLGLIYRIILASHILRSGVPQSEIAVETPSSWVQSLPTEQLSRPAFVVWISTMMPFMYTAASTMFHCILFSSNHANFRPSPFCLPQLDAETLLWTNPWDAIPLSLACHSSSMGGKWRRLYSSNEDSFSFRAFANSLIGYKGPTVILIKSTSGDVFGYYSDSVWKFSNHWYGEDADSYLFRLNPLGFFNPTGTGKHHQYLCLPPSHRKRDLKGLAIGGIGPDYPRLHLTESLERCRASAVDSTFENGPLLSDELESHFDVDILEVFAVNVSDHDYEDFRKSGELQVAVHEATRKQAAQVDKSQFLDDFVAGAFLNKGFEHREHTNGRHDFRRDED